MSMRSCFEFEEGLAAPAGNDSAGLAAYALIALTRIVAPDDDVHAQSSGCRRHATDRSVLSATTCEMI